MQVTTAPHGSCELSVQVRLVPKLLHQRGVDPRRIPAVTDQQGIGCQYVDLARHAARKLMNPLHRIRGKEPRRPPGHFEPEIDILQGLVEAEGLKVVVKRNPLPQGLMDRVGQD